MVRTLVLASLIAATLGGSAIAQPRPWRHHHHHWRRCHWVWRRGHHVRVCLRR